MEKLRFLTLIEKIKSLEQCIAESDVAFENRLSPSEIRSLAGEIRDWLKEKSESVESLLNTDEEYDESRAVPMAVIEKVTRPKIAYSVQDA